MMTKSQLVFKAVDILCYQMQNHVHFPLIEQVQDVAYSPEGGRATSGNLFFEKTRLASGEKLPILVNIHGGGFVMGDKDYRESLCEFYAHNGFFVFDINYRMPPEVVFPVWRLLFGIWPGKPMEFLYISFLGVGIVIV